MPSKPLNRSLHAAKATKQDEFYTQLSDIEKELRHYTKHFKNKTVLCNCDDPKVSNFFHYFSVTVRPTHLPSAWGWAHDVGHEQIQTKYGQAGILAAGDRRTSS
jgi:hypothetical protein